MCSDERLAAHSLGTIYALHLIFRMADDLNNMPNEAPPQTDEACRGGSSRRFMTSSGRTAVPGGPIIGLYALEGAKPDDRSRADDSTKCGRSSRRSCPADGRGDRPHVPRTLPAAHRPLTRPIRCGPAASL